MTRKELVDIYSEEAVKAYEDLDFDLEYFNQAYQGEYGDDISFVRDLIEQISPEVLELPPYIHIDWEWTAKDVMIDYNEQNGHYFRKL